MPDSELRHLLLLSHFEQDASRIAHSLSKSSTTYQLYFSPLQALSQNTPESDRFWTYLMRQDCQLILITLPNKPQNLSLILSALRQARPYLPILLLAERLDEAILVNALKMGATDYISWHRLPQLETAINRALREQTVLRERQQAEEALAQSERRFQRFVASISDHIYVTEVTADGSYHNIYISPHVTKLTGYPVEQFLNNRQFWPKVIIHPEDRAQAKYQSDKLAQGENGEVEYRIVHRNGQVRWMRDSGQVTKEDGRLMIYGVVSDITARKKAEQALRENEARLRAIFDTAVDGIIITDEAGLIDAYNQGAENILGYTAEEMIGRNIATLMPEVYRSPHSQQLKSLRQTHQNKPIGFGQEVTGLHKNGYPKPLELSISEVLLGERKLYTVIVRDITERKDAEQRIYQLNEELEQRVIDRTRELSALYNITLVASQSLPLEDTLNNALRHTLAAMRTTIGTIHLLDEAEDHLYLYTEHGVPEYLLHHIQQLNPTAGFGSWVLKNEEPLVIPNLKEHPITPDYLSTSHLNTYLGVPVRSGANLLGVLSVLGPHYQQFNVEDVALLTSIADQIGVTIENARLREQAAQIAVRQERERLARELHDSVTQSLYSLVLLTGSGQRMYHNGTFTEVDSYLADLGQIAQQALKEMRLLVHQLRPEMLKKLGLVGALQQRLDAVEGRAKIETRLLVDEEFDLPPNLEESFYRIAQEALNNTLKHAEATAVTVELLCQHGKSYLIVQDNGQGFSPHQLKDGGGMGLIGIQERVATFGGQIEFASKPDGGTRLTVSVDTPHQQPVT